MHFMALSWSQMYVFIHSLQKVKICFTVNDLLAPPWCLFNFSGSSGMLNR